MEPFRYHRASSLAEAIERTQGGAMPHAGGTELVNWIKDGIASPRELVDLGALGLGDIRVDGDRLWIGALARLADVAANVLVRSGAAALAQAIEASASPQIRHMATLGGNLLQQTRCPYFRMPALGFGVPCHLRQPGSGCAALAGEHRGASVFARGACRATHPSDPAAALLALGAALHIVGPNGARRSMPVADLYGAEPGSFGLAPGELLTEISVPLDNRNRPSRFLKLRDRASFDFALVSGAAAYASGRWSLALGGLAWGPHRCPSAATLPERPSAAAVRGAVAADLEGAAPLRGNEFKLELATRLAVLLIAAESPVPPSPVPLPLSQ